MNVLLIYPPNPAYCILNEDFSCCEPLGLEYIAATLLENHCVDLMDMRFDKDLPAKLGGRRYQIVGVAVPFTTSINTCNLIFETVRLLSPDSITIAGGHYPSTSVAGLALAHVDYIVRGEGVDSVRELLAAIERGASVNEVAGIGIVDNGTVKTTATRAVTSLDSHPLPARQLLAINHKRYFHAHYSPITLMRFSLGCPFNCSFCILWKMTDRRYFTRLHEAIIDELNTIDNNNIYVVDDEAFIQAKRMSELARLLIESGLQKTFHMYVRSDTIVNNPQLFADWAQAGLDSVLVGLESIFDNELEDYNKKTSLLQAKNCIDILHSNGIEIRANFIIKPDYTLDKFRQVREAIHELNIDRPTFAILTPFIGTDTYAQVKDELIIDTPEFYDCFHTLTRTRLDIKTFYKEFADLFRAAQHRDTSGSNRKVFYAGKGDRFHTFVDKIENAYRYYSTAT